MDSQPKEVFYSGDQKQSNDGVLTHREIAGGQFKSVSSLELESGKVIQVYIQRLDFPVSLVIQVFTNKDGSTGVLFLVCNDLSLDYHCITELYQKRWRIED